MYIVVTLVNKGGWWSPVNMTTYLDAESAEQAAVASTNGDTRCVVVRPVFETASVGEQVTTMRHPL